MEFSDVVRRRRMVRRYSDRPVDPAALTRILDTARRGPSAGFSQGQRFVVATDVALRQRIADACGEQEAIGRGLPRWLSGAPVHVLPCVDRGAYLDRYQEPDKAQSAGPDGWRVPFEWVDTGAAFMLLLLAAVDEGLSAGFLDIDADAIAQAIDIPDGWTPMGLVTIGHAAQDGRPGSQNRRRRRLAEVVHRLEV